MFKNIVVAGLFALFSIWLFMGTLRSEDKDSKTSAHQSGKHQAPEQQTPVAPDAKTKEVVGAINDFGFNLFKELDKNGKDKNIFISPFSISIAMTMACNGAMENTRKEIEKVLGYDKLKHHDINYAFKTLLQRLNYSGKTVQVAIANAIWVNEDYELLPGFQRKTRESFQAESVAMKFIDENKKSINTWIAMQTKDKIKDMLPSIEPDQVMFLINAIYFNGVWAEEFESSDTKPQDFWISRDKTVRTQMMHQTEYFAFLDTKDFQAVVLPYKLDRKNPSKLAMYVFLPKEKDGVHELLKTLDEKNLQTWIKDLKPQNVRVSLPKFKIENGATDLKASLMALGIKQAFGDKANFRGMLVMEPKTPLLISDIVHKACVDVNETGTEAAACTFVTVFCGGVARPPVEFVADHPFVFMIRDNVTGVILFMGVLNNPSVP